MSDPQNNGGISKCCANLPQPGDDELTGLLEDVESLKLPEQIFLLACRLPVYVRDAVGVIPRLYTPKDSSRAQPIVGLLWEPYGVYSLITRDNLVVSVPGDKKEFPHDQINEAVKLVSHYIQIQHDSSKLYEDEVLSELALQNNLDSRPVGMGLLFETAELALQNNLDSRPVGMGLLFETAELALQNN